MVTVLFLFALPEPTTTRKATTEGICDYIQGMGDASIISDAQISARPALPDKSAVRYGVEGPGWTVSPDQEPELNINLSDLTGQASYVKKIVLAPHTNIRSVQCIMAKKLDNGNQIQIEDTVQLDESGEIDFSQAVQLLSITIRVKVVLDPTVNIEVKVGIYGCFVRPGEGVWGWSLGWIQG